MKGLVPALLLLLRYVDPFIGTTESSVETRWGNEGGTYPGAVAVSGFMQLTPQTRDGGYDYRDSVIYDFSCTGHHSGYPGGSGGRFFVMPLAGGQPDAPRPFSHRDEAASPGYYSVRLKDDGTLIEAVATPRSGMFRFTFRAGVTPRVFVGDTANSVFIFDKKYTVRTPVPGGVIFAFAPTTTLLLRVSASTVDASSARRNIAVECTASFEVLKERVATQWARALSVVTINDDDLVHKRIFYTALYHSLLLPWIISDVDGRYRGADGKIHTVLSGTEYGGFSPWDTFRSLHPLLTLLFPDKESDIVRSMLDVYRQRGHLPTESMTGNHSVSIIVDALEKGLRVDSALAYQAMSRSLVLGPYVQDDMAVYRRMAYVPLDHPESVTRTLEYAYDDACLAQLPGPYQGMLDSASRAYRRLFDPATLLLLPRQGDSVDRHPGNAGYKEGDAWAYSYFVPQDPSGLIDLMGGGALFSARLDSALSDGRIIFDNETVLQVPYLFDEAGFSPLTQHWVRTFMEDRYHDTPGGLPGNDDLGAMSSWYVWSALGIFPVCPGKPGYAIGTPLFRDVTLKLGGRSLRIAAPKASRQNVYVQSVRVNGRAYRDASMPVTDGEIAFVMGPRPGPALLPSNTRRAVFHLSGVSAPVSVEASAAVTVAFTLTNTGSEGTHQVRLWADGRLVGSKNCRVSANTAVRDSLTCSFYQPGRIPLRLDSIALPDMVVTTPLRPLPDHPEVVAMVADPLVRFRDTLRIHVTVRYDGWETRRVRLPVCIDDDTAFIRAFPGMEPGEQREESLAWPVDAVGMHTLHIGPWKQPFKVYNSARETCVLDLDTMATAGTVRDRSGFGNDAVVMGEPGAALSSHRYLGLHRYLRLPETPSLDKMGETLTMMLWVYPLDRPGRGLTDIFTKGDFHVLQITGYSLTFFAGGWGRGDCTVPLPADWTGHWHHIAGVCGPDGLTVYIDGQQKGFTRMPKTIPLSFDGAPWTIGRNAEFPGQRIFEGYVDRPKVFFGALDAGAVLDIFHSESKSARSTP
jgi:putative alpha-1,2-mannosidase